MPTGEFSVETQASVAGVTALGANGSSVIRRQIRRSSVSESGSAQWVS